VEVKQVKVKRSLVGERFGRWVVTAQAEDYVDRKGKRYAQWHAVCSCGGTAAVLGSSLRKGDSASCGCWRRERTSEVNTKHGHSRRRQSTPEYRSWKHMLGRCLNPNDKDFADYGGRGITVCEEWQSTRGFVQFYADMGPRPGPDYSLDRIDNDGHYERNNVRWATRTEQARNQRRTKLDPDKAAAIRADEGTVREIAQRFGLSPEHVRAVRDNKIWKRQGAAA
jgi:hypothetical protein